MPWETPLQTIADSITGPVAKAVGVLVIAITGLGMAFSEGGSWLRKGVSIVFGLAIVCTIGALTAFLFEMLLASRFLRVVLDKSEDDARR